MKIIIFVSFLVVLTSCDISDPEADKIGFEISVANDSGVNYDNAKLMIGGMKDGKFIKTESYSLPTLFARTSNNESQTIALDDNRWKPNLDLIRAIPSNRAYFSIQFEGKEEVLLYDFWEKYKGELVSVTISEGRVIKNDDGELTISIEKDTVLAHLRSDRDTLP
jgi:hypothetical protein